MKFIELLKSMLLDSGRVWINKSTSGINASGINHDVFDESKLRKQLVIDYLNRELRVFAESKKIVDNEVVTMPEMLCVFKSGQTASDSDLDGALQS